MSIALETSLSIRSRLNGHADYSSDIGQLLGDLAPVNENVWLLLLTVRSHIDFADISWLEGWVEWVEVLLLEDCFESLVVSTISSFLIGGGLGEVKEQISSLNSDIETIFKSDQGRVGVNLGDVTVGCKLQYSFWNRHWEHAIEFIKIWNHSNFGISGCLRIDGIEEKLELLGSSRLEVIVDLLFLVVGVNWVWIFSLLSALGVKWSHQNDQRWSSFDNSFQHWLESCEIASV